ncbi:TPA_inf: ORF1+2p [Cleome droserifolia amalgavirus 1]|uniref:ORF1+2p n=1 Tax=Cleome droserifolia amalgavirus 1 TaxID=2069321 RepID=UPI000DC1F5D2|nr:ORF1+2p [Cleome droserifolia amalgavirus 1]DAB41677.1 TPA_inf: ORF1+2p [Cleome droserifolia amalgavirus 1]
MAEHQDPQAQGGAVGGDVEEVNLLEGIGGIPTAAEERNRLQEALRPLIANGVNIERITVNDCLRLGFTVEQLARAIRVLTSIASDEMRDLIFSQAHLSRLAPAARSVTLDHILAICEWMKTERGAQAIRNLQTSAKQERRAVGGRTVADVSMLQAFNQQVADWSAQVKEARKEIEEEMAELRAQLALKQQELNDSLAAINESYWPASSYKAPALNVVQSQAYALYAADCRRSGTVPLPAGSLGYSKAVELFGQQVREDHQLQYLRAEEARDTLSEYLQRLVGLKAGQGRRREVENFVPSWQEWVSQLLMRYPLERRRWLLNRLVVGRINPPGREPRTRLLREVMPAELMKAKRQAGIRHRPGLQRKIEEAGGGSRGAEMTGRVRVLVEWGRERHRTIPVARGKFEAGIRKIIGGGELLNWREDSSMYRGGGNSADAIRMLFSADPIPPGRVLTDFWREGSARQALFIEELFEVPDGPGCCVMKNFNNEATSGPYLRGQGLKGKYGLKRILEAEMWRYYDSFASGECGLKNLPWFAARVGFRTKLLTQEVAWAKMQKGEALGRAVMMMDALEQAASSPMYNVLSSYTFRRRLEPRCGFKNGVVRASSDWGVLWRRVQQAKVIVELDWSKFDRERPREDLEFIVKVVCSCFRPRDDRGRRLLQAYQEMMRRALVERALITDSGGVFLVDGMVPSGSLWTGWIDTALNILYIKAICVELGIALSAVEVFCAGDDNLTLFMYDPGDVILKEFRTLLNQYFRAGIKEEDFFIHRPPFDVRKYQATFPVGSDLRGGTSRMLDRATWIEFEGEIEVDEARGRSHRWEYRFKGKPKFLSNYWLPDGRPVRPTRDNLEKLLWPEGVHATLEDYEGAVISMVVDNPFNHHNVNHMLMRYVIIQQLRRMSVAVGELDLLLKLGKIRAKGDEEVPMPQIAPWRRGELQAKMEDYNDAQRHLAVFEDFMRGVSTLYSRAPEGGLDAWQITDIMRGMGSVGEGQFGNETLSWLKWMHHHPLTRYLRAARRYQDPSMPVELEPSQRAEALRAFEALRGRLLYDGFASSEEYAIWVARLVKLRYLA